MQENDEREGPWRKILLSGGAILTAAAAYNAFARKGVDKLTNLIGGEEGGFEWRDRRVAFTKRGEGPPILLIHGIHAAGWSYEWRNNVDALSRTNTVYTIDLLGFGQSDRPAIRYSARLYISLISDFVSRVIDAPTVLVASSLSGAYAIVLAARDPHRFPAVALIAPSGLVRLNEPVGIGGEAGRLAVDTPIAGTAMFNAMVSRPNLRRYLRNAYSNDSLVTSELVEIDVRHALRRLSQPALLVWGEQGSTAPVEEFRGFRELKRDLEISVLSPAGDLPHDERAEDFNVILSTWLNRLSLSSAPTLATLPGTPADLPRTQQLS